MTIVREPMIYDGPGGPFEGVIVYEDEVTTLRPGVLVVPNILGQKKEDDDQAEKLARLGYVALSCDIYGQGKRTRLQDADRGKYMDELNKDRALMRDRLSASLEALRGFDRVDPDRIAAIGFCFGGKAVLDMARAGLPILGGVSFHGVYDRPDYESVSPIKARLLICHGWLDPIGPPETVVALGKELEDAGADWQIHAYGGAGHAFTDVERKDADNPALAFEPRADRRSWQAMSNFLKEILV